MTPEPADRGRPAEGPEPPSSEVPGMEVDDVVPAPEAEPEPAPEPEAAPDVESVTDAEAEPEWVRRRRLDAVFGDGAHGQSLGDRWYRDQVPPHHG